MVFARSLLMVLALFAALSARAVQFTDSILTVQIQWPAEAVNKIIPLGKVVTLSHEELGAPTQAIFLGRFVGNPGEPDILGLFIPSLNELHYVSPEKTRVVDQNGACIKKFRLKAFVQTLKQEGKTCASYALYNYLRQTSLSAAAPKKLKTYFLTPEARAKLVRRLNFEVYDDSDLGVENALADVAQQEGLGLDQFFVFHPLLLKNKIIEMLKNARPIFLRFSVRDQMQDQDVSLIDSVGEYPGNYLNHLWLPRQETAPGKAPGAHAVVMLGVFSVGTQRYFLVSDPNFSLPRIWKSEYFNGASIKGLKSWAFEQ